MDNLTKILKPLEIVAELDKYIIGQGDAKKNVAIALRNRWRRMNVKSDLQSEIMPNNTALIPEVSASVSSVRLPTPIIISISG